MTATAILDALLTWRDPAKFVHVHEAAEDAQQQGRKIDALIIGAWRSTGHQREAVEVKISWSDLKRELDNPVKSDWWWARAHRFWLATTPDVVRLHKDDIPATWGVLQVDDGKVRQVRPAPLNTSPQPLPWGCVVGLIRNASGAGANALQQAYIRGRNEESKRAKEVAEARGKPADEWQARQWKEAFDEVQEVRAMLRGEGMRLEELLQLRRDLGALGWLPNLAAVVEGLERQARTVSDAVAKYRAVLDAATKPVEVAS